MAVTSSDRFVCVVGAPRCATTTLAGFLKDHPSVCFSSVKEPHFFSQFDLCGLATRELTERVEEDYLRRYFAGRRCDQAVLAEGSVTYLYTPEQMEPLLRLWPDTKFIIALRNPLEMLLSLHQRLLFMGDEVVEDFERAWRLAPERRRGRHVPRTCVDPRWLQYDEVAQLGKYVDRFVSAVGRERCFILLFDDLLRDPQAVYRDMLDFAGLPYHHRLDFRARRESRGYRSAALQRLLKRPPIIAGEKFRSRVKPLKELELEKGWPTRMVFAARRRLLHWNSRPAAVPQLTEAFGAELAAGLSGDVGRLGEIVGRDLSHWLEPQVAVARSTNADASRKSERRESSAGMPAYRSG